MDGPVKKTRIYAYSPRDKDATTEPCRLTPGRLDRIHALFVHNILSTEMVHALADPESRHDFTTRELRQLKREPNGYLCTPRGQFRTLFARSNTLYYSCTTKGVDALIAHRRITLKEAEIWQALQGKRKPAEFFHDAGTGYLTASAQLWARENGVTFLSLYDILRDMPQRSDPLAIKIQKGHLVPDTVFALQDGQSEPVLYIDETDMGSEQIEPHQLKNATITHKYESYRHMLYHDTHVPIFGIENVKLLFLGTKPLRMQNIKQAFKKIALNDSLVSGIGPIYLRYVPAFDPEIHIKLPPTSMLFATEWDRIDNTPTMLFKKKATEKSAA